MRPPAPHPPRALLSAARKDGLAEFAAGLRELGWELIATSGTAAHLRSARVQAATSCEAIGTEELFGGRVKTLDVRVFAGLLYRRGHAQDEENMRVRGFRPVDLVACTFYAPGGIDGGVSAADPDQIDVGGPSMVRAGAKNHRAVVTLVDPADYPRVIAWLRAGDGRPESVPVEARRGLAAKAFRVTSAYDEAIAKWLDSVDQS